MDSLQKWLVLLLVFLTLLCEYRANSRRETSLTRRKRYVVFPEGSSFSIALCLTVPALTAYEEDTFTEGVNWGISYDLPNESKSALEPFLQLRHDVNHAENHYVNEKRPLPSKQYPLKHSDWKYDSKYSMKPNKKKFYKSHYNYLQRRHRRELYNKLEIILNAMNFDGRTCVLRALCEASQRLMPKGNTLVEEMLRIVFSIPLKRIFSFEPLEHHTYAHAHRAGFDGENCAAIFSSCSFSLIDMALGKYDAPQTSNTVPPFGHFMR